MKGKPSVGVDEIISECINRFWLTYCSESCMSSGQGRESSQPDSFTHALKLVSQAVACQAFIRAQAVSYTYGFR